MIVKGVYAKGIYEAEIPFFTDHILNICWYSMSPRYDQVLLTC